MAGTRMTSKSYGALIGWTSEDLGSRLVLRLESFESSDKTAADDLHRHFLIMTKQQALLLSHYLLQQSGQEPRPAPGLRRRILGRLKGRPKA